jgi:hypothetical protein
MTSVMGSFEAKHYGSNLHTVEELRQRSEEMFTIFLKNTPTWERKLLTEVKVTTVAIFGNSVCKVERLLVCLQHNEFKYTCDEHI